jgi:hypothetical protein
MKEKKEEDINLKNLGETQGFFYIFAIGIKKNVIFVLWQQ